MLYPAAAKAQLCSIGLYEIMWRSLFEKIQILHNLIFMLQHFIVNNLQLLLSVVEVGPAAGLPEIVVSVISASRRALFTWFTWPCRINIYSVPEWDTGRVLPSLLSQSKLEVEKLGVGKYTKNASFFFQVLAPWQQWLCLKISLGQIWRYVIPAVFFAFTCLFQLCVGHLQIDCQVLKSLCSTAVSRKALWRR